MAESNVPETELKEIPSQPGYFVNRAGDVYSGWKLGCVEGRSKTLRKMTPAKHKSGHMYVVTKWSKKVRARKAAVHHLVLETFVGPRRNGMECRHLNGDPADNRLCNLAWGTREENVRDAIRHGTFRPYGRTATALS